MTIRVLMRPNLMVRGAMLRRAVAVVCAVALLAVGFAHSIHHFVGPVSAIAMSLDIGASDGMPEASKKAPIAIEHCPGCSMIAVAVLASPFDPGHVPPELPARKVDERSPHPPGVETPPPITTI